VNAGRRSETSSRTGLPSARLGSHLCTDEGRDATDATAALARAGLELGPPVRIVRTVLDTIDGRLHAAGLRLELEEQPTFQLVLTGADGTPPARLEVDEEPRLVTELPPGPFAARLAAVAKERALLPVLTVRTRTRTAQRRDRRDKVTVTAHLHEQVRVDGVAARTAKLPRWALELEPTEGHDAALDQALDRLAGRGFGTEPGDLVALVAGAAGVELAGRTSSPTVPLEPGEPAPEAFRRVLANLAQTIADNVEETTEDTDPEFLHDLRVAVRRSRAVLGEAKGAVPEALRLRMREDLAWVQQSTGDARDLAVQVLGWDDLVRPLTAADPAGLQVIRAEVERQRQDAQRALVRDLRSTRFRRLLASWQKALSAPWTVDKPLRPIGPHVAKHIDRAQARLLDHGRAITPDSPAESLHDLRKDAKRLRYLLECFGSLLEPKARKAFVQHLKDLQDNLGEHQDAEVQVGRLRDLAAELHRRPRVGAPAVLAMGQLTELLEQRRAAERADFADRFAAYDAKRTRRALDELLAPLWDPR
jgi:CHAD domain-containing protein